MATKRIGQRRGPGKFRAQVMDPVTKRRRSITASSEAELQRRLAKMRDVKLGLRYGEISVREAERAMRPALGMGLTVRDIWERYREGIRLPSQPAADNAWAKILAPKLSALPAVDLDEGTLRKWMTEMEATRGGRDGTGYAPRTLGLAFSFLQAAYRQAVAAGLLGAVPWGVYRPHLPKGPRYFREAAGTFEELLAIFEAARAHDLCAWGVGRYSAAYFACVVLGLTGMRQAEAAGLSWSALEIDVPPYMAQIRAQAPKGWKKRFAGESPRIEPKGKKMRHHALHPSVVSVLRYQRDQLRKRGWYRDDGPVFPNEQGQWRTTGFVLRPTTFRRFVVAAGLPNVKAWSPHSLRHSCATLEAVATGGDLRWVQARTGHSDLKVLEGYIHRSGRGLPVSKLPELPPSLLGPALPELVVPGVEVLDGEASLPLLPSRPGEGSAVGQAVAVGALDAFTEQAITLPWAMPEREKEAPKERPLAELAREWLAAGRKPQPRPKAVTEMADRAWQRAYHREVYARASKEDARKAAHNAKRAALGAWGKAVHAAERSAAACLLGAGVAP